MKRLAVIVLLNIPVVGALSEAIAFHIHNRATGVIVSSGERREYVLHVPPAYDASRPTPLVISMHGAGGWGAQERDVSRWDRLADEERFIVVYPSAADNSGPRVWRSQQNAGLGKDVRFIADLITALESKYNIDRDRIYANGLSNGGGMSFALSCTLSDRIAAVGLVAAAETLPWKWCTDRHAVPMIAFHGTADPVIPYNGGVSWIAEYRFPSVPIWAAKWARRNGCAEKPIEASVASDVTRRTYSKCTDGADVVLYTLHGGGHTWPGGEPMPEWLTGPTSRSIDATRLMWSFFRAHPLTWNQ